jgi:hypothetical protein
MKEAKAQADRDSQRRDYLQSLVCKVSQMNIPAALCNCFRIIGYSAINASLFMNFPPGIILTGQIYIIKLHIATVV